MCTLSFYPISNSDFILTSNRDEAPGRETISPKKYIENGIELLYPKDAVAGGTWIGSSENNRVVSLMNGGFEAHIRKESYRKSRGLVVKDLLSAKNVISEIENYDFQDIEPFTVIIIDWNNGLHLYELVWDEKQYHFMEKPLAPQIWSSSPLYSKELKEKRERWFEEFIANSPKQTDLQILDFHKAAGDGNKFSDLIMDRGFVKTKSITQVIKTGQEVLMNYENLPG